MGNQIDLEDIKGKVEVDQYQTDLAAILRTTYHVDGKMEITRNGEILDNDYTPI